jgi:diguanylate cyclase (GGDEF)-like protein
VEVKDSEVLRLIRIDEMTGLYNKVYFLDRVRDDMLRSERYGWPLSLLMISVDDFEKIKESYGQIISDNVAVTVADMIRKFARNTDIVGRYDTAKFSLLLPGTAGEGAESIAERLRHRITSHLFSTSTGEPIQVTCSLGLSEFHDSFKDVHDFVTAGETARLLAEGKGGNRWMVAPQPDHSARETP